MFAFPSKIKTARYKYPANSGAQFVPIGMPTICQKSCPPDLTYILSTKNSIILQISSAVYLLSPFRGSHINSYHILCILQHQLLICPSSHMSFSLAFSTLLFSWVFFSSDSHSFHHFNVQLCHPPPLHFTTTTFLYFIHCYYILYLLLIFQLHF